MTVVPVRKYESIWLKLKAKHTVKLIAPSRFHPRIKKAVIKEKYNDLGFKLMTSEENKRYKITSTSKNNILSFTLVDEILINRL